MTSLYQLVIETMRVPATTKLKLWHISGMVDLTLSHVHGIETTFKGRGAI
jgi:hypothetical protein